MFVILLYVLTGRSAKRVILDREPNQEEDIMVMKSDLVLVTGATGYAGGRLIPALLAAGYRVRDVG